MYTLPPGGIQGENRSEKRFGANQIIQSSWSSANQGAFAELRRRALRGQVKFSSGGPPFLSHVDDGRSASPGARPEALAPPSEQLSHRVCPPKLLPRLFGRCRHCGHRLHHKALRCRPPAIAASGFPAPARSAGRAPYLSRCVSCPWPHVSLVCAAAGHSELSVAPLVG